MTNHPPHLDGYVKWLRSQVGHELIYLVYTIAFVFDEAGNLLVQKRYDFDWLSVPGGVYEPHETIEQAVLREIHEETGIDCTVEKFIGVFSHPDYNLRYPTGDEVQCWTAAFVCRATSTIIQVDGQEALSAEFMPPAQAIAKFPLMYQHALQAILDDKTPFIEPVYYEAELKPYYPILRKYVGPARIILPGCVGAIFNENNDILAVYKKSKNRWTLPGGLADLGETTTGTLRREILEETGLEIEVTDIVGIYSEPEMMYLHLASGDELQTVDLLMTGRVVGGNLKADGEEIAHVQFMPLAELLAQPNLQPLHYQFLNDVKNRPQVPFIR